LVNTIQIVKRPGNNKEIAIGFSEGGWHAAESLIVARYLMFTQVYGHKTRLAYNYHLQNALKELLPDHVYPSPNTLEDYLKWDDWKVLGMISSRQGGEHGARILKRNHFRKVFQLSDVLTGKGAKKYDQVKQALKDMAQEIEDGKNWYKDDAEILIKESLSKETKKLSYFSNVVKNLKTPKTFYFYVDHEHVSIAEEKLKKLEKENV